MDEYYTKYAKPLGKLNIVEIKTNLINWRDNLRDELESLIYIKSALNREGLNKIETKVKNKLTDIITKLEGISLKEIECIREFINHIHNKIDTEIDDKVYTKLEFIRDNYNKILLNIQKMAASSPVILDMKEKYEKNKTSLLSLKKKETFTETNKKPNYNMNNTCETEKNSTKDHDWIDKLVNDVDQLNKESSLPVKKKNLNETKDYTIDKDIDTIVHNFNKSLIDNKYKSSSKAMTTPVRDKKKITQAKSKQDLRTLTPSHRDNSLARGTNYEAIKNITEELNHVKNFCQELKNSVQENCIMQNERKSFDKIKNDHIKLHADVGILKDDMKELTNSLQEMSKRILALEEENKNLRAHNKNLVNYIQGLNESNYPKKRNNDDRHLYICDQNNPRHDYGIYDNLKNIRNDASTPLSEISAFNTVHNLSSVEMMNNVNNNIELNKRRRFLIPKSETEY